MSVSNYANELSTRKAQNLLRHLTPIQSPQDRWITHAGKRYLNFSSNNYLGLANHPQVRQAFLDGVQAWGVGAGASRLINGSLQPFHELEEALARFKNTESALVFNSGYHANLGALSCLLQADDVYFSDELNHASLIDGLRLSKAKKVIFPHNNLEALQALMEQERRRSPQAKFIMVTESVFSMDGDVCPLKGLLDLAEAFNSLLYLDEAHATGVFGPTGAGLAEIHRGHPAMKKNRVIQMGTLGKALGCFGAYIAGEPSLIDFLINCARPFIYTTALPPALATAALKALELLQTQPQLKDQLWHNLTYFENSWNEKFPQQKLKLQSPIVPIQLKDAATALKASQSLHQQGIWATAIRPPTVPEGTSRVRLTFMANHHSNDLDRLVEAFQSLHSNLANDPL